jgi:hypothetical protein
LIDAQGRLVGINTLIYTAGGESAGEATGIGINLATPSELAATALSDIVNYGHVIRGWLGVSVEVLLSEDASGRPLQRLIVTGLASDGPAERAGIALNDVIVAMDDALVVDGRAAMMQIAAPAPRSTYYGFSSTETAKSLRSKQWSAPAQATADPQALQCASGILIWALRLCASSDSASAILAATSPNRCAPASDTPIRLLRR